METANEFLLIIKTRARRFAALEEAVKRLHSYDVPEIIALPIEKGSRDYLAGFRNPSAPPGSSGLPLLR